jgi:hypothetical protein
MISNIYLGATELTNTNRYVQSIRNLAYPDLDFSTVKKASFEGKAITPSKFSGYRIQTEWVIVGYTFSDLATQRELFVKLLGDVIASGPQLLRLTKSNGTTVQVSVKTVDVLSDVSDPDPLNSPMMVEFQAEYPFLVDENIQNEDVFIFQGGGMPIPMPIPMPMNYGGTNEVILVNNGNYPAFPIFTFYGPLTNPTITNITTGKSLSLNLNLVDAGDIVEVDTFLRTARRLPTLLNQRQYVTGDFWTIMVGNNVIHLGSAVDNQVGKCVVTFSDTYLGI